MSKTKTLTAYLFESLEEINKATEANIDTAVKKARATIEISEQVLNVAQMKIEVINATGRLSDAFQEICDEPFELPAPENPEPDEKKDSVNGDNINDDDTTTYGNRRISNTTLGKRNALNREY